MEIVSRIKIARLETQVVLKFSQYMINLFILHLCFLLILILRRNQVLFIVTDYKRNRTDQNSNTDKQHNEQIIYKSIPQPLKHINLVKKHIVKQPMHQHCRKRSYNAGTKYLYVHQIDHSTPGRAADGIDNILVAGGVQNVFHQKQEQD